MSHLRESYIQRQVTTYAKTRGWHCFKIDVFNFGGMPDYMLLREPGQICFIEFKAPGKQPNKRQLWVINLLRGLGFSVYVIDDIERGKDIVK